jgi:hypothetical protein
VPGGAAGVRMMLRALRVRLGPNQDVSKALQLRAYCICPPSVEIEYGGTKRYQWTVDNPEQSLNLVGAQMQKFSDIIYRISWGRICVRYKVVLGKAPFSVTVDKPFSVPFEMAGPVVLAEGLAPKEATLVFLWIRTDGQGGFPPKRENANYASSGRKGKLAALSCGLIAPLTDKQRLLREGSWAGLGGGLPHELWHAMRDLIKNQAGFSGFLPDNHKSEDWKTVKKELLAQGMPAPKYQYEDLYPTFLTWRIIRQLETRFGRLENWGTGPSAEAVKAGPKPSTGKRRP